MMCESKISKVLLSGLQYGKMLTGRTHIFQTQVQAKAFSSVNETSEYPINLHIVVEYAMKFAHTPGYVSKLVTC